MIDMAVRGLHIYCGVFLVSSFNISTSFAEVMALSVTILIFVVHRKKYS